MACPPLTLRSVKAAPLTSAELDNNFLTLQDFTNTLEVMVNELMRSYTPAAYYVTSASGDDSYYIELTPAPTALSDLTGKLIAIRPTVGNTGAAALTVNTLAATPILKGASTALSDGDITAGKIFMVIFDGANFQLQ